MGTDNTNTDRLAARGIGRETFRRGGWLHDACRTARELGLGDHLDDVRAGYAAERAEIEPGAAP